RLAGEQHDLAAPDAEQIAQHLDNGLIGPSILRRCRDGHLERAVAFTLNAGAFGIWLRSDGQYQSLGVVRNLDHATPSNRTLPSRTAVEPSSMAISKSLLIPIDRPSIGCRPARRSRIRSRVCRNRAKVGRQRSGASS